MSETTHLTAHGDVEPEHEHHFQDLETQAHAARLGMWVFLASEALLFGALFTLYSAARVQHAESFREGIAHTDKVLGSLNTLILLTSSFTVAAAVHVLKAGRRGTAILCLLASIAMGALFMVFKLLEWSHHFHEGIYPGGGTHFFHEHPAQGLPIFFTLYYIMTGLHALHVLAGMTVLGIMALGIVRGLVSPSHAHRLEVGALYWHLVDVVWIFLWPIFYLTGGS